MPYQHRALTQKSTNVSLRSYNEEPHALLKAQKDSVTKKGWAHFVGEETGKGRYDTDAQKKDKYQLTWFASLALRESRKINMPLYCSELKPNMAQRANLLTNTVANHWNKLSDEKIGANNINTFKNRPDIDLNGYYSSPELRVSRQYTHCSLKLLKLLHLFLYEIMIVK